MTITFGDEAFDSVTRVLNAISPITARINGHDRQITRAIDAALYVRPIDEYGAGEGKEDALDWNDVETIHIY